MTKVTKLYKILVTLARCHKILERIGWSSNQEILDRQEYIADFASVDNNGGNSPTGYAIAGADDNLDNNVVIKGGVKIPFDRNNYDTTLTLGADLRF
jgi:hypothetical protein